MENFVDSDQSQINKYFQDKAEALKQRYGGRIQQFMIVPTIENIYMKYTTKDNGSLDMPTKTEMIDQTIPHTKMRD